MIFNANRYSLMYSTRSWILINLLLCTVFTLHHPKGLLRTPRPRGPLGCLDSETRYIFMELNPNIWQTVKPYPMSFVKPCPIECSCFVDYNGDHVVFCYDQSIRIFPRDLNLSTALLVVSWTYIAEILPGTFAHLPNMVCLRVDFNVVLHLGPRTFEGLQKLVTLAICCNHIQTIDVDAFTGLSSLRYIDLSFNLFLLHLPNHVFAELTLLEYLDLSNSAISKLSNQVFFGLSHLEFLDLSRNHIKDLDTNIFSGLHNLRILDLSANKISNLSMAVFSELYKLKFLDLSTNCISSLPAKIFVGISLLEILNVSSNFITSLPDQLFDGLICLQYLDISNNSITSLQNNTFLKQSNLEYLELHSNCISNLPDNLFTTQSSLSYLSISQNELNTMNRQAFLNVKNLTYLNVSNNKLKYCLRDECNNRWLALDLPRLKTLVISYNQIEFRQEVFPPFTRNKIEELYIDGLPIVVGMFNYKNENPWLPRNLKVLSIKHSTFSIAVFMIPHPRYIPIVLFQNLPRLEVLDLSGVTLIKLNTHNDPPQSILTEGMFTNTTRIEQLSINDLGIRAAPGEVLNSLRHLKRLHLSANKIESVNFSFLPSRLWTQLNEIDLSYNPFICDCNIMWFRRWINTTNITLVNIHNSLAYTCMYPRDMKDLPLLNITNMNHCYAAPPDNVIMITLLSLFTFSFVSLIASFIQKFRWHVFYWQMKVQSRNRYHQEIADQHTYDYDAFVMYDKADGEWVRNLLVPQLEGDSEGNLRLCIHERDWTPGQPILENIMESIESSRKHLLIMSNTFATSYWCNYEMILAQSSSVLEDRANITLVLLEEIAPINMTPRLRLEKQRHTYIEWTEDDVGQKLFWTRLRKALEKPQHSLVHELPPRSAVIELHNSHS